MLPELICEGVPSGAAGGSEGWGDKALRRDKVSILITNDISYILGTVVLNVTLCFQGGEGSKQCVTALIVSKNCQNRDIGRGGRQNFGNFALRTV